MAGGTARAAVVARLVVGAKKPQVGIVESRLVEVEQRDGDAVAGAVAAVSRAVVGPARLLQCLESTLVVGQPQPSEQGAIDAAAALECPEDIRRGHGLPVGQR